MKNINNQKFMVTMESVMLYSYAVFLIILGTLKYGQCENIKCYSCSTKEDIRCVNPENELPLKQCDTNAMFEMKTFAEKIDSKLSPKFDVDLHGDHILPLRCMKQVTIVHGKEYIIRGCQLESGGHLDICTVVKNETQKLHIGTVTHCSLCHKDGCNFSSSLEAFKITTVLMSALVPKFMFF